MLENRFFFFLIRKPLITQNLVLACWIVSSSIFFLNACVLKFKLVIFGTCHCTGKSLVGIYTEPISPLKSGQPLKSGYFISETVLSCGGCLLGMTQTQLFHKELKVSVIIVVAIVEVVVQPAAVKLLGLYFIFQQRSH